MTALFVAAAIPLFFALILAEATVSWWRGLRLYRLNDAVTDLSCGIGEQMTGLLVKASLFAVYVAVHGLVPWSWPTDSVWTWVGGFVLVDHQYYWWHRATHRVRLLWTTHVVHHQSEDYNLAVALRQAWLSKFSGLFFELPMALLGVPPVVYATCAILNTLYQFWIHTELVRSTGPLEAVLNTPAHHRVHHAVDPDYVDKNYAGVFIVWDRLYGTFVPETHPATYGTVTPHRSWNPVWANVRPVVDLARQTARIPGLADRVRFVLGPPEWRPDSLGGPIAIPTPEPGRRTWDAQAAPAVHGYIVAHFVVVACAVTALLVYADTLPLAVTAAAVGAILLTTAVWGGLFEQRSWAVPVEAARLVGLAGAALVGAAVGAWPAVVALAVAGVVGVSAVWLAGPARAGTPVPITR